MLKQIVQFYSRTFGCSSHFIKAVFCVYYFILFSCSVIYFIEKFLAPNFDYQGDPNILITIQDVDILALIIEEVIDFF